MHASSVVPTPRRRTRRQRIIRSLGGLAVLALFAVAGIAGSQPSSDPSETDDRASLRSTEPQLSGEDVYARHCSVCHGETGLGLEEAREAFPEHHQRCARCHRPGNPPTMTHAQMEMRQHDVFEIGVPPPLRGEGSIAAHSSSEALRTYLSAAMPRWNPGSLSAAEYAAVAEFLLELNGR